MIPYIRELCVGTDRVVYIHGLCVDTSLTTGGDNILELDGAIIRQCEYVAVTVNTWQN